jgi:hypothetical protein
MYLLVGDNIGAMDVMGIRSIKCGNPCRFCAIEKGRMWDIEDTANVPLRLSSEYRKFLSTAFSCFCKDVKGNLLSQDEVHTLAECKRLGLHPILPALLRLEEPFPMFTAYTYAPADLLHTFLSGIMRDWIVSTVVIGKTTYIRAFIPIYVHDYPHNALIPIFVHLYLYLCICTYIRTISCCILQESTERV